MPSFIQGYMHDGSPNQWKTMSVREIVKCVRGKTNQDVVCLCGFHAVMGYEQIDALFSSQSLAVHQLSSAKSGRDTFREYFLEHLVKYDWTQNVW